MKELTARFKTFYAQELGSEFPQDPPYAAVRGRSRQYSVHGITRAPFIIGR